MTVYVDDMEAEYKPPHRPGIVYIMCHMIADTPEELHAMARKIGVDQRWYQGDHYDITKSKRKLAVKAGAKEITWREAGKMMLGRRQKLSQTSTDQRRSTKSSGTTRRSERSNKR